MYKTKDLDGLRLVRGKLPIGTKECGDTLVAWAKEGFAEGDNELANKFGCDWVCGSKGAIDKARNKAGLPPRDWSVSAG